MGAATQRGSTLRRLAALILMTAAGCTSQLPSVPSQPSHVRLGTGTAQTGTHWARPSEFDTVRKIGYDFVILDVSGDEPATWQEALDKATRSGLKLIVGLWPPPYTHNADGTWTIQPQGIDFLRLLKARANAVMALFVYNEPYWADPDGKATTTDGCGFYSADDLRKLRTTIRTVWPDAKIYHDLGDPSVYAPGGYWWQEKKQCIGDKYRDQTEVADYVGVWSYPFDISKGYTKQQSLSALQQETDFVRTRMKPARAVVLGQSFAGRKYGMRWPTKNELLDWNCALRQSGAEIISWYPWRQDIYQDYLANHRDYWPLTVEPACSTSRRQG